ncbi:cytosolic protein [Thiohalocapsa halophila]|uniref:Cytosolic protein n=1 Tax=Thiohalocapsa halophila TaxID=69359 RepID=A0ABS1CNT5_9GAMM|nr:DUF4351 domain-containing protein [Thiohalocapsa halophila]MBK1633604.1 cytosolic protein [Thiohalocapsa halophila]
MTEPETPADDYDNPWKTMLAHAFPELMAFYFPDAHARIDWTREHSFLDTELRQVVRDAELGKRDADALVRVTRQDGAEQWVYIHIEVQGQRDADFAKRMFTYNYRLYDRYDQPIASLAILADLSPDWKPRGFDLQQLGCTHRFRFPVVKLLDFTDRLHQLERDRNPFALVTAAHLYTARTRHDPNARYRFKRRLVQLLYRHGWTRQRVLDLFAVLDWMMRLPENLEQQLWQDIQALEGAQAMRYITSVERIGRRIGWKDGQLAGKQEGKQEGKREGKQEGQAALLVMLLSQRFGPLSEDTRARLEQADAAQLERWAKRLLDAATLAEVFDEH